MSSHNVLCGNLQLSALPLFSPRRHCESRALRFLRCFAVKIYTHIIYCWSCNSGGTIEIVLRLKASFHLTQPNGRNATNAADGPTNLKTIGRSVEKTKIGLNAPPGHYRCASFQFSGISTQRNASNVRNAMHATHVRNASSSQ